MRWLACREGSKLGAAAALAVLFSAKPTVFAWRIWTVDRSGAARPYASASEWWMFCTAPEPRR